MNNLHAMQKQQACHTHAMRWMQNVLPAKLQRMKEIRRKISYQEQERLTNGVHVTAPDKLRISMVGIQTRIRKQRRHPVVIATNTAPLQLIYVDRITYPDDERGKYKHALIMMDHASKSKYKIDVEGKNLSAEYAKAFVTMIQKTDQRDPTPGKTIRVGPDHELRGVREEASKWGIICEVRNSQGYDQMREMDKATREMMLATKKFIHALPSTKRNDVDARFSRCLSYAMQIDHDLNTNEVLKQIDPHRWSPAQQEELHISKKMITPKEEYENVKSKIFQLDNALLKLPVVSDTFRVMDHIDQSNRLDELASTISLRNQLCGLDSKFCYQCECEHPGICHLDQRFMCRHCGKTHSHICLTMRVSKKNQNIYDMEDRKTIQEKDNYQYDRLQSPITGIFNANRLGNKHEMSNNDPNGKTDIKDSQRSQQHTSQKHDGDHINSTTRNIPDCPSRKDEFAYQIETHMSKKEVDTSIISPGGTTNLLSTERFLDFLNYCNQCDKAIPDQSKISQRVEFPTYQFVDYPDCIRILLRHRPSKTQRVFNWENSFSHLVQNVFSAEENIILLQLLITNASIDDITGHLTTNRFMKEKPASMIKMDQKEALEMCRDLSEPRNMCYFTCPSSYLFMPKQLYDILRFSFPSSTPSFCRQGMEEYVQWVFDQHKMVVPTSYKPNDTSNILRGFRFWKIQSPLYYLGQENVWSAIKEWCHSECIPHLGISEKYDAFTDKSLYEPKTYEPKSYVVTRCLFGTSHSDSEPGSTIIERFQCLDVCPLKFYTHLNCFPRVQPEITVGHLVWSNKSYAVFTSEDNTVEMKELPCSTPDDARLKAVRHSSQHPTDGKHKWEHTHTGYTRAKESDHELHERMRQTLSASTEGLW